MIEIAENTKYVLAADRNNPDEARAHIYAYDEAGDLWPMCEYGWNRSNGEAFSILRGWGSRRGTCKTCQRRAEDGLEPIKQAKGHKTRWL